MNERPFVVLRHELPPGGPRPSHWDLFWQDGSNLRAWALDEPPAPAVRCRALALPPHRLDYLDYEGPVSGGRGSVRRHDRGACELLVDTPQEVIVRLRGVRFCGTVSLRATGDAWEAVCRTDERTDEEADEQADGGEEQAGGG